MKSTQRQCKPQQKFLLFFQEDPNLKVPLTILYSCLIPLIIYANLVLIIGIFKLKCHNVTSCQILFLILFFSDLITTCTFRVISNSHARYSFMRNINRPLHQCCV